MELVKLHGIILGPAPNKVKQFKFNLPGIFKSRVFFVIFTIINLKQNNHEKIFSSIR